MPGYRIAAEDHGSPMIHPIAYWTAATRMLEPVIGRNDGPVFFTVRDRHWEMTVPLDYEANSRLVLAKLEDPAFFKEAETMQERTCGEVDAFAYRLRDLDASKLSNAQLAAENRRLYETWERMCVWGDVVNKVDFDHFLLTNRLMALLEERKKARGAAEPVAELFSVLTTATKKSPIQHHDPDLLRLVEIIQSDPQLALLFSQPTEAVLAGLSAFPGFARLFQQHVRTHDWMQYHYDGPEILPPAHFVGLLKEQLRQPQSAAFTLRQLEEKDRELQRRQAELEAKLDLSEKDSYWLQVARSFMYLKALRKDTVYRAGRNVENFLREIGRRLGISLDLVRFLTIDEAETLLLERRPADLSLLKERLRFCAVWVEAGKASISVGSEAKRIESLIERPQAVTVSELKGTPACAGLARGTVKIIAKASDMPKMNKGDILVSPATNPNLVSAMKKAAAIVTDEGGITCHAAIVSRELNIPCVVGTRVATRAFKDGDLVEVDAITGIVRKL